MFITSFSISNVRSIPSLNIDPSRTVNVFTGPNNAGKTTIIKSLYLMQDPNSLSYIDIRKGTQANITIAVHDATRQLGRGQDTYVSSLAQQGNFKLSGQGALTANEQRGGIYPFFASRKVAIYQQDIRKQYADTIAANLSNLPAKLAMLVSPDHPMHEAYKAACEAVIGFPVFNIPSDSGQEPGIYFHDQETLPLRAMGDGISNMVGFLSTLASADGRIILIEEPENDIHPAALKRLLKFILACSKNNQFFITTHSNIVLKALGSLESTNVYSLLSKRENRIVTTSALKITSPEERRAALMELGYEFYDEDSFSGWIFFEESSAERIVRDFLIPWFAPSIVNRVRTFSTKSVTKMEARFSEFNSLFCFLNLESKYRNRAWVIVDSGSDEKRIIDTLKAGYAEKPNGWDASHFLQLDQHDFEEYYPQKFKAEIVTVAEETDKHLRREKKKALLDAVIAWCRDDPSAAKDAFAVSAKFVIDILVKIEKTLADHSL